MHIPGMFCVHSGVFLLASSRWNQSAAHDECMARVSEVCDWEGGGRTEPHHLARVFDKEKEEGERRVLVVVQRVSCTSCIDGVGLLTSCQPLAACLGAKYAIIMHGAHMCVYTCIYMYQQVGASMCWAGPWQVACTMLLQ